MRASLGSSTPVHTRPLCCDFDVKGIGEPTLEELLAEPAVRMLMIRDGVDEAFVRRLAAEVVERLRQRQSQAMPAMNATMYPITGTVMTTSASAKSEKPSRF